MMFPISVSEPFSHRHGPLMGISKLGCFVSDYQSMYGCVCVCLCVYVTVIVCVCLCAVCLRALGNRE